PTPVPSPPTPDNVQVGSPCGIFCNVGRMFTFGLDFVCQPPAPCASWIAPAANAAAHAPPTSSQKEDPVAQAKVDPPAPAEKMALNLNARLARGAVCELYCDFIIDPVQTGGTSLIIDMQPPLGPPAGGVNAVTSIVGPLLGKLAIDVLGFHGQSLDTVPLGGKAALYARPSAAPDGMAATFTSDCNQEGQTVLGHPATGSDLAGAYEFDYVVDCRGTIHYVLSATRAGMDPGTASGSFEMPVHYPKLNVQLVGGSNQDAAGRILAGKGTLTFHISLTDADAGDDMTRVVPTITLEGAPLKGEISVTSNEFDWETPTIDLPSGFYYEVFRAVGAYKVGTDFVKSDPVQLTLNVGDPADANLVKVLTTRLSANHVHPGDRVSLLADIECMGLPGYIQATIHWTDGSRAEKPPPLACNGAQTLTLGAHAFLSGSYSPCVELVKVNAYREPITGVYTNCETPLQLFVQSSSGNEATTQGTSAPGGSVDGAGAGEQRTVSPPQGTTDAGATSTTDKLVTQAKNAATSASDAAGGVGFSLFHGTTGFIFI